VFVYYAPLISCFDAEQTWIYDITILLTTDDSVWI